jgi:uncharacterized protein (DUF433 family)
LTPQQLADAIAALPRMEPAERARAARRLIEETKGVLSGVRLEAIAEMLDRGMTYQQAAAELEVSAAAINAAVTGQRARSPRQRSRRGRRRPGSGAGEPGGGQPR